MNPPLDFLYGWVQQLQRSYNELLHAHHELLLRVQELEYRLLLLQSQADAMEAYLETDEPGTTPHAD